MTHSDPINWNDFAESGIGPQTPLPAEQRLQQKPSGILPSGEMNFFDTRQLQEVRTESPDSRPSGINLPFPYPNTETEEKYGFIGATASGYASHRSRYSDIPIEEQQFSDKWWATSGILKTYGPLSDPLQDEERESGVFHKLGDVSRFSNGSGIKDRQIDDFEIFGLFYYHERLPSDFSPKKAFTVKIPYLSSYIVTSGGGFVPYGKEK